MPIQEYKKIFCLETRKQESKNIMLKYPSKIPIIVQLFENSKLNLEKNKYLVPSDLSFGQFIYIIRKKIKISETEALFFYINNKIHNNNKNISDIYDDEVGEDGYMYVYVSAESTFG
jgi:GABA(A) receptor-associated protein